MFLSLSHEPQAGSYSLLANAIHTRQIYSTMTIKTGYVIAGKVIMTVEVAGVRECGQLMQNNLVCLTSLSSHNKSLFTL